MNQTTWFRIPWVAPLLVATLHVPLAALWALLEGRHNPIEVAAWQLVAWPLLAGASVSTIGPALLALPKSARLPRSKRLLGVVAGAALTAAASYLLLAQASGLSVWALCWLMAYLGAAMFQAVGRIPQATARQAPQSHNAA